jgi:DNA-binding LytR/AlgR family response regulator
MAKFKILILEDYAHIAYEFAQILDDEGYEAEVALSVEEAEAALSKDKLPDLALLDISIGEEKYGGIQVAEFIRKKKSIPIIFITSHGDDPDIFEKAKKVNPAAFLEKGLVNFAEEVPKTIELAIHNYLNKGSEGGDVPIAKAERPLFTRGKICINASVKDGKESKKRRLILKLDDILYFEAQGYETKIQTKKASYSLSILFKKFNEQLVEHIIGENPFWRVQRSYVVNMKNIVGYDNGHVYIMEDDYMRGIPIRQDTYLKLKEEWFPPFKT